jgi:TPR repeat protein
MFALGAPHGGGRGLPVDRRMAQKWFRVAAELGHGQAQLMLGRYLASGVGGELNPEEAREWLERAAAQGVADAQHDLAELSPPQGDAEWTCASIRSLPRLPEQLTAETEATCGFVLSR